MSDRGVQATTFAKTHEAGGDGLLWPSNREAQVGTRGSVWLVVRQDAGGSAYLAAGSIVMCTANRRYPFIILHVADGDAVMGTLLMVGHEDAFLRQLEHGEAIVLMRGAK